MTHSLGSFSVALAALALFAACRKEEKRKVRTEPWPAPVLSVSASALQGKSARFTLESGSVRLDVKSGRTRRDGSIRRLEGEIELDLAHVENTRARVRADLLDLDFSLAGAAQGPDAAFTLQALRALELDADRPAEERERDRWAELRIVGFDALPARGDLGSMAEKDPAQIRALGELTLHRFRVPVSLELDVELVSDVGGETPSIRVRTRRPLTVSLAAHDIVPRRAASAETAGRSAAESEKDRVREARVSAELLFRAARQGPTSPSNP